MAFLLKALTLLSLLLFCSCAARVHDDDHDHDHDHHDLRHREDRRASRKGLHVSRWPFNIPFFPGNIPKPTNDILEANVGKSPNVETDYQGAWTLENENVGVSAMHMQLLPNNKAIMYDATSLGPSNIKFPPDMPCRNIPDKKGEQDCFAHAIEYDVNTRQVRTLKLETNAWCSSGGLTVDGNLISTGGFLDGSHGVRLLTRNHKGLFQENAKGLAGPRWYATQEKLGDGSFVVFGGRGEFSIDIIQKEGNGNSPQKIDFPFLKETTDAFENNLYPFAHLLPDGNVFFFANKRAVIVNPKTGEIIRELPQLPGGSRNYPASGSSVLLPLNLGLPKPDMTIEPVKVEVLICGGAPTEAAAQAEKKILMPALQDCGRITVSDPNSKWEIEDMPTRRVMHDMLVLPNGEVLILNGATQGVSGWHLGEGPVRRPVVYSPEKLPGERFKELEAAEIPRMYHSSAVVLQDGRVLVAGSNTNPNYNFTEKYPTEVRVETFAPHYTDPALNIYRPQIKKPSVKKSMRYGQEYTVEVEIEGNSANKEDIKVTMLAPPFPTHGYSQNQRLVVMDAVDYKAGEVTFVSPPSGNFCPPGYFILYVVHRGVPSAGVWVKIE